MLTRPASARPLTSGRNPLASGEIWPDHLRAGLPAGAAPGRGPGVKFTTCYFSNSIGGRSKTSGGWDTHGFDDTRMYPIVEAYHLPVTDQTLPTLLEDLEQRGMLDETLVCGWVNSAARRRSTRTPAAIIGPTATAPARRRRREAGLRPRQIRQAASEPAEDAFTPEDLAATIYYRVGINPKAHIHDTQDRPLMISSGEPVMDVIA
ncbi:MAG: hypothetical protein CM1200mP34_3920 [Verrucomicrobiales bacterium]|nr:MAG: hypothetical protein CM1200mP34_3920 [Verrucomicrobiales bacterium]